LKKYTNATLCYKLSYDYNVANFHKYCNGKGPTLTVVRSPTG